MKHLGAVITAAIVCLAFAAAAQDKSSAPTWITAKNKPCRIWNPQPQPNETVTWSGACKNGLASGKGVLKWTENGRPDVEFDGIYANGKRNGPGVMITPDGQRSEGNWTDDEIIVQDPNSI